MKGLIVLLAAFAASHAFLEDLLEAEADWNDLKVTWGANPLNDQYFDSMPRTVTKAEKKGWEKISDCNTTAPWRGQRYVKDGDYAVVLLYDVNGYIAGIQTSFPQSTKNFPKSLLKPPFVEDDDRYTISAYFVEPSTICTTGRTEEEFETQGTGTELYIQNSTDPEASTLMPHKEKDIQDTLWTKGKCFVTMGMHYWYNLSEDMDCDGFYPVFLMYNNGKLNSFGWSLGADFSSPRYEHPTESTLKLFFKSPPRCLYNTGRTSTQHIYLTSSPATNFC